MRFARFAAALLCGVLLAGCSGAPEQSATPTADGEGYPDLSQWRPSVTPTRQEWTDEEAQAERLRLAEVQRPENAAGLPVPDLVEWVDIADWPKAYAQCMTAAGYVATALPDGSVEMGPVPESQISARDIVGWECSSKYPVHPSQDGALSAEQLTVLYEYYTDFFIPCATAAGVKWKDPSIPSEAVFKERMMGGEVEPWIPASIVTWEPASVSIGDMNTDEGREFWTRCPASPPYEYLHP